MANPKGKPGRSAFTAERLARALLLICAVVAIFAVCAITLYLFAKGLPALHEVGVGELLFGTVWKPTAAEPSFGIAYIILSSIVGTAASVLLGAGRQKKGDPLDFAAGITLHKKRGDYVHKGESLATFYGAADKFEAAAAEYRSGLVYGAEKPEEAPLVYALVTKDGVERY